MNIKISKSFFKGFVRCGNILILIIILVYSCRDDEPVENQDRTTKTDDNRIVNNSVSSLNDNFILFFQENQKIMKTEEMGSEPGAQIDYQTGLAAMYHSTFTSIHVKDRQFFAGANGHALYVYEIKNDGKLGPSTGYKWTGDPITTLAGIQVAEKGYILMQYYGTSVCEVFEINQDGSVGNCTFSEGWSFSFPDAFPYYVNGEAYMIFNNSQGNIFKGKISYDGKVTRSNAGGWWSGECGPAVSYRQDGKTYFVVVKNITNSSNSEWFIQQVNSDGTLGQETDRFVWNKQCTHLVAFKHNGKSMIFEYNKNNSDWQIHEVTGEGKMSQLISGGKDAGTWTNVLGYDLPNSINSFRYEIGWNISDSDGNPTSWSAKYNFPWSGNTKLGGGSAVANIDGDASGLGDAVMAGIQDRTDPYDRFYYRIAWNIDKTGKYNSLGEAVISPPIISLYQAGAGADIADIDANGRPDLLLMYIDDPVYPTDNNFRYLIAWNLDKNGKPANWSQLFFGPTMGTYNAGGGTALGDIDHNGRPDLVVMGIDDVQNGENHIWYNIGKNLDVNGNVTSWTERKYFYYPLGDKSQGGGTALYDIDKNGKLDIIFFDQDNPTGPNNYWCYVGWDLDINGNARAWTNRLIFPSLGNIESGGGLAVYDFDQNGTPDLFMMSVDNPYGPD